MDKNENDVFVHRTAVVDEGADIDVGTRIWHFTHVRSGVTIGSSCTLGQGVYVGKNVEIGDNVKLQNHVDVFEGVTLEDSVFCGPSVVFTNVNTPRSNFPTDESDYESTLVQEGATIGANTTIICGNKLGRYCFIGAGSVVTRDIPDFQYVLGSPAESKGFACVCGELKKTDKRIKGWSCQNCSRQYRYDGGRMTLIRKEE